MGSQSKRADDAVLAVWNAGTLPFVGASAALFTLVGAAAVAILRTRVLPRWTGWLGAVAAVVSLVAILGFVEPDLAMIGFLGFLLSALWIVTTSIAMLRSARAANSAPARFLNCDTSALGLTSVRTIGEPNTSTVGLRTQDKEVSPNMRPTTRGLPSPKAWPKCR